MIARTPARRLLSLGLISLSLLSVAAPAEAGAVPSGQPTGGGAQRPAIVTLSYSDLTKAIRERKIRSAVINPFGSKIELVMRSGQRANANYAPTDATLPARIADSGAQVEVRPLPSADGSGGFPGYAFMFIGPLILITIGVLFYFGNRQDKKAQAAAVGGDKKKDKDEDEHERPTYFHDVAGCEEAVEELKEFVVFLRNPRRFMRLGAKMPGGALLYGPPGTGKTMLARALAYESGVEFFSMSGSEFVERYVGVGASRVRDLFKKAKKAENGAVVFIDEIDAVGKARASAADTGNDERDQTLNQLLTELDGFSGRQRIVVIAATNRKDLLDPALLRPGRLSRHIAVGLPSENGREQILRVHARSKPLAADVSLEELARFTAGSAGADLENMLNEAAILAAMKDQEHITRADLLEGHLRAIAGRESADQTEDPLEREITAFHEAGHVLCAELCPEHEKAQRATIIRRGNAAGLALYGRVDRSLHSTAYLHEQLVCTLGGRAAEQIVFNKVSSGAKNDLEIVNSIARQAVEELGLSPQFGQLVSVSRGRSVVADQTRAEVDRYIREIAAAAYEDALALLRAHRPALDRLAALLLERGDIGRTEIVQAIDEHTPLPLAPVLGPAISPRPVAAPVAEHEPEPLETHAQRRRRPSRVSVIDGALAAVVRWRAKRAGPVSADN